MATSEQTASGESTTPVVKKFLKPIKTKLRLKKVDVRQCRLCLRLLPRVDTRDPLTTDSDLRWKILDAVLVEIFSEDKVTSVCINCLMVVDIINDFRMTCRMADTLHGTKLMMMHPGSWLGDENKSGLNSCHQLIKRNRAEMEALYKCSGVNNEEIHRLIQREQRVLDTKGSPEKNPAREDMTSTVELNEGAVAVNTKETTVDGLPEVSNPSAPAEEDAQLEEARRNTAKKDAKKYMCELCGKVLQKMYREEHINMHMGRKPYKCSEKNCDKSFGSHVVMSIHVINVHRRENQRFECQTCHKSIKGLAFYNQHLQTHQATNSLKVPCKVCGKTFYKRYLRDHMFVHTGEKPYKCEFCKRKFAARNNLAVHRRKQHLDQQTNQEFQDVAEQILQECFVGTVGEC